MQTKGVTKKNSFLKPKKEEILKVPKFSDPQSSRLRDIDFTKYYILLQTP